MNDGSIISEQINVADAHPSGKQPFKRKQYIEKFKTLTDGFIKGRESDRFLNTVENLKHLRPNELKGLNIQVIPKVKSLTKRAKNGIFWFFKKLAYFLSLWLKYHSKNHILLVFLSLID